MFVNFRKCHGSEYESGYNYEKVMNFPGFQVYQVSAYGMLHKVLNMAE